MKHLRRLSAALLLSLAPALPSQDAAKDDARLVACINRFAADLHARLGADADPTCGPASIALALLMLVPGARGETAEELRRVLHLPDDLRGERLLTAAERQLRLVGGIPGSCGFGVVPELRTRNDLWTQRGREVVPAYAEALSAHFGATLRQLDFAGDPEQARATINAAVREETFHRIAELLPPGSLTPLTRHVLTNAMWYRGSWAHEFYRPTKPAPFHVDADHTVDAPMMHVTSDFRYAENEAWQAVQLPFEDTMIVFEVYLPRQGQPLAVAERALLENRLGAHGKAKPVRLSMPAYRIRVAHRLRGPLEALGLRTAFTHGADFSGIDRTEPLQIDEVLHGTWIGVDENGVEAAAATAVVMKAGAAIREDPIKMRADRPFAFGLRDTRTGLLLFVGRVTDPTAGA